MQTKSNLRVAVQDLISGLTEVRIWFMLAWQEVKQRYRRSIIGPFWITISTGVMIAGMGPLYGKLFAQDIGAYFAYLATSIVLWQMISQTITESCQAFIASEQFIKQVKLPLTLHVLRVVCKNFLIFAHNFVVVILVFIFLPPKIGLELLLLPFGLIVLAANLVWIGSVLGLLSARFRDIPLIVNSLVQVAFFLTPVIWQPGMLGRHAWAVKSNPLYHMMEIVRAPLLGIDPASMSWLIVLMMTLVGYGFMMTLFARYRARIAYWV